MPEIMLDYCYDRFLILRFCPKQIAAYVNLSVKNFIVIIRFLKASNRFAAMYFPIFYQFYFKVHHTIVIVGISLLFMLVVHLGFLVGKLYTNVQF